MSPNISTVLNHIIFPYSALVMKDALLWLHNFRCCGEAVADGRLILRMRNGERCQVFTCADYVRCLSVIQLTI